MDSMTLKGRRIVSGLEAVTIPDGRSVNTARVGFWRATGIAGEPVYEITIDGGLIYFISADAAAYLARSLACDLYEAGRITPGEITDEMLRDTED